MNIRSHVSAYRVKRGWLPLESQTLTAVLLPEGGFHLSDNREGIAMERGRDGGK